MQKPHLLSVTTIFLLLLDTCGLFAQTPVTRKQTENRSQATRNPNVILSTELGKTKNVHRAGNLFFAGQFTKADVELIKAGKFKRVITLRTDGEIEWDEKAAIENAGIEFIELPFRSPDALTDEVFDEIRELLADDSSKTLLHCGSANRVGGVWLPYRVLDENMPLEFAIQEAEEIGLRTPFIKEKALEYIKRQRHLNNTKIPRSELSVKPGINDSFLASDLSVEKMIQRFEVESREIYLARNKIIEVTGIKPGEKVADIGSGTGLFAIRFADLVGKNGWVYAVDIAPRFVQHVAHQSEQRQLDNVTSVLCHQDHVNLPQQSVDVVFICDTYHHFEFPKSTMQSIFNALKPGGRLIVIDFKRIRGESREWIMGHVRAGKDVVRAEIQDTGFAFGREVFVEGLKENYCLIFTKPE